MKNITKSLILLILTVSSVHSEGFYIGAKASQMDWDSAILKQAIKQEKLTNLGSLAIGSQRYTNLQPSNVEMRMYGFTAGIIGRSASLNYGFSTGNSNFNLNANDYYSTSLMYLRQKEFEAKRTDQDLSLSILLSDTGFYIFGGLKAQSYTYDISDNPSFAIGTSNGQIFAGSPRLSLSKPNSKINFVSYGPAAGLGYTKALTNRLSISASVGMIYMFSYYQQNGLAFIVDGGTGGTGNTVSLVKTRDTQQSIKIGGYTFSLNFNYLLGNGILQLGLIKQEAQLTSMMNDYLMYSFGPKGPSVDWGSFLIKQMLNINEKDVFQGITLGYQHKLSD